MSPAQPANPLKTIITSVIATLCSAVILAVGTALVVKINNVHDSTIKIETMLLFHKEGLDKMSVRIEALERRLAQ